MIVEIRKAVDPNTGAVREAVVIMPTRPSQAHVPIMRIRPRRR